LTDRIKIDATELLSARMSADRLRVLLTLRDEAGQNVTISLPAGCINTVLTALPRSPDTGPLHALDTWSMEPVGNGHDLVLTLRTPEGMAISFSAKPWQLEGMATIATYGRRTRVPDKSVH